MPHNLSDKSPDILKSQIDKTGKSPTEESAVKARLAMILSGDDFNTDNILVQFDEETYQRIIAEKKKKSQDDMFTFKSKCGKSKQIPLKDILIEN